MMNSMNIFNGHRPAQKEENGVVNNGKPRKRRGRDFRSFFSFLMHKFKLFQRNFISAFPFLNLCCTNF